MSNSYRIRTQVGVDKSLNILLDQDFEFLEILSLKILQNQIYTRPCSDYGVIIGRVVANGGFGIPNAKISIFIPLTAEDELNPIISELYPYKSLSDVNEDGYRYNLLPYTKSHSGHNPTGTFFDREDVLTNPTLIEVFDKYYKYTARTNESGDYMIFGVPTGSQTIHVDIDLSDIGEFSLSPQDLIRIGVATDSQVAGTNFKSSTNLAELPQIISIDRTVEVLPLWGQPEVCNIGINRSDFDLTEEFNITITPTAIFMGSIISSNDDQFLKKNCKPKLKQGNLCNLVAGPGEIIAIRQTINQDVNGRPILEVAELEQGGQVIDDNGTWLIDVPMNLDYVTTNEFGERVISTDPKIGIPTRAKYRFKIKWNQSPTLNEAIKRGYFLVPNIKEWGWVSPGIDPLDTNSVSNPSYQEALASYAFSLDWSDYGNQQMIQEAIDCEDKFYPMVYNKVYTVSQLIDQYRKGFLPNRMVSIKNILDDACESENVKFPTNDAVLRFDILYLLFVIMMFIFKPILYILIIVVHILAWLLKYVLGPIFALILGAVFPIIVQLCDLVNQIIDGIKNIVSLNPLDCPELDDVNPLIDKILNFYKFFTSINLPNLSYPDCELCDCKQGGSPDPGPIDPSGTNINATNIVENSGINSYLSKYSFASSYGVGLTNSGIFSFPSNIASLISGQAINKDTPSPKATVPQLNFYGVGTGGLRTIFTNSLPISERLNLFNNKSKYFNSDSINNPGGGVNRIKVTFESNVNNPSTKYHFDNVIAISVVPSQLQYFTPGKLISFQDPNLTSDVNLTGVTSFNQFGTSSITGTPINTATTINVSYANPNGSGTISPVNSQYVITQDPDDALFHKFAMDVEYFQVITGMTYGSFSASSNPGNIYSLNNRFLGNNMKLEILEPDNCWFSSTTINPISYFTDASNQGIVFLVRGVDPNTSRRQHTYDLSVLFGHPMGTPGYTVTGDYKMNIPIQGSYKSVAHSMTSNVTLPDTINTTLNLYYDSYHFQPSTGVGGFSAFTSNLPSYYSSLDGSNLTFTPTGNIYPLLNACLPNPTYGARIYSMFSIPFNGFQINYNAFTPIPCDFYSPVNNTITYTRGYFPNEIVDGGSVFLQESEVELDPPTGSGILKQNGFVYAPRYSSTFTYSTLGTSGRQIIMRSDRLPTSTKLTNDSGNSFALHGNPSFEIFYLDDEGTVENEPQSLNTPQVVDPEGSEEIQDIGIGGGVLDTFTCTGMIPLECYNGTSGEIDIKPSSDPCYFNGASNNAEVMNNGCYVLVSSILDTLINGRDFRLLTEWFSRIQITFGACRNVWSHIFTNNWINGTLYAFSFKNDRFFTSPTTSVSNPFNPPDGGPQITKPNFPYSRYCRETLFLHPTNNFYYRCSPYDGFDFIGADAPSSVLLGSFGGNKRNLKYPTTIMDLGPRSLYLQELIMSDDYDGYVVNRLNETSYTDVEDILNLLILSRLVNQTFLQAIFSVGGANVLSYFNKRSKFFTDGDYAQMISISSELGITDFESSNYPSLPTPLQDPIYFSNSNSSDVTIGIFFSSDTQVRDFITPKRTIVVPSGTTNNPCTFNYFNVFSQKVPFYQWQVKQSEAGASQDSIFGSQKNDWYTDPITSSFLTNNYQSMDRLQPSSRYFRTNGSTQTQYYKGYIFSVDSSGNYNASPSSQDPNSPLSRVITVGAPFHFYFGLKKGKTAFDRFAKKWLNFEIITD